VILPWQRGLAGDVSGGQEVDLPHPVAGSLRPARPARTRTGRSIRGDPRSSPAVWTRSRGRSRGFPTLPGRSTYATQDASNLSVCCRISRNTCRGPEGPTQPDGVARG